MLPRRLTALVSAGALALQMGCFAYGPMQDSIQGNGQLVGVVLNDRGRAQSSDRLGAEIDRVEGRLVALTDSLVSLEVTRTVSLRGSSSAWTGERVDLPRSGVRGFQQRSFSKRKTTLFVIGAVAAIGLFVSLVTLDVFGDGRPGDGSGCVPPECPDA